MLKRDAALDALMLAQQIQQRMAGDENADIWVQRLLYLARGLDPLIPHRLGLVSDLYFRLLVSDEDSTRVKLRRLIDHPTTPQPEREAALAALRRLDSA